MHLMTGSSAKKMALVAVTTVGLLLTGAATAAALPGVPSSPRVPPKAPWLGWVPSTIPAPPSLPAFPNTPAFTKAPAPAREPAASSQIWNALGQTTVEFEKVSGHADGASEK